MTTVLWYRNAPITWRLARRLRHKYDFLSVDAHNDVAGPSQSIHRGGVAYNRHDSLSRPPWGLLGCVNDPPRHCRAARYPLWV
jgi:hypothetical protein